MTPTNEVDMTVPSVIDLSHHNSDPDFAKVASAGVVGIFHKATQGTSYVDPKFAARRAAAEKAGLLFASYHFLEAGNVSAQMAHYLDTVQPVYGERVCIDHEPLSGHPDPSIDDLRAAVAYLAADPRNLQVAIYSGHLIKDQVPSGAVDESLEATALWVAQYTTASAPSWPKATWPVWTLWQYTDSATVPGITGPVDGDRFNGSNDALRRWMGPAPAPSGYTPAHGRVRGVTQG